MAMFIETKSNEKIRADANAAGDYITTTNGYVPDYLFEVGVSSSGTEINITSGMIIQDGVKIIIDAPERVEVGREASGTYEYKLYLKIKMNDPKNPEFVYMRSNITPQKDNVFSNMNAGVNHIEIATFTKNTSGVAGLKKTLKKSVKKDIGITEVRPNASPYLSPGKTFDMRLTLEEARGKTFMGSIFNNSNILNETLVGVCLPEIGNTIRLKGAYSSGTNGQAYCLIELEYVAGTTWKIATATVTYSFNTNAGLVGSLAGLFYKG